VAINCSRALALDHPPPGAPPGSCGGGVDSPAVALWVAGNVLGAALGLGANASVPAAPAAPGYSLLTGGFDDAAPGFNISDDIRWWGLARNCPGRRGAVKRP
jgi:hypothetical protein